MKNATNHDSVTVCGSVVVPGMTIACEYNGKPRIGRIEEIVSFGGHNPVLVVAVPEGWKRFDVTKVTGLVIN